MAMVSPTPSFLEDTTIGRELERRADARPERVYLRFADTSLTMGELNRKANKLAHAFRQIGVGRGHRVAVMLPNLPIHFVAFLAFAKLGVTQVPVNIHLRGASLEYVLKHSDPCAIVADAGFADALLPELERSSCHTVIWNGEMDIAGLRQYSLEQLLEAGDDISPPGTATPEDLLSVCYTSGTSGPPKGVMVTDRMLRTAGAGATYAGDLRPGDVQFMWAPLFHMGGIQSLMMGLENDITLGLVERFSASKFWGQVREYKATQIHYVGGVLSILMKQPPRLDDTHNTVRIAWGSATPPTEWRAFEKRFAVEIREIYGMTECSSITHVNAGRRVGFVGPALPHFESRIVNQEGEVAGLNEMGEIHIRERAPGVMTKGYFRKPEETDKSIRNGWYRTGDLGSMDKDGYLRFLGRTKDNIRRRGENVSAWEVEQVLRGHPAVKDCAVLGVERVDLGDEDIKAFVELRPGTSVDPIELIKWCEQRLAYFQVPRYIAFVEELPRTRPTLRIKKAELSRSTDGCWDLEQTDYKLARN